MQKPIGQAPQATQTLPAYSPRCSVQQGRRFAPIGIAKRKLTEFTNSMKWTKLNFWKTPKFIKGTFVPFPGLPELESSEACTESPSASTVALGQASPTHSSPARTRIESSQGIISPDHSSNLKGVMGYPKTNQAGARKLKKRIC